jgi:prepilin-type N-terminal cleavage/methylation domain-containing protein
VASVIIKVRAAFTLYEIMVVIALLGFFALLALPRMLWHVRSQVRHELEALALMLSHMQQRALVSGQEQHMIFDTQQHTYSFEGIVYHLPPSVRFGFLPHVQGSPGNPNKVLADAVTFDHHIVKVHPMGVISAGTVYLTDVHHQVLYALTCSVGTIAAIRIYVFNNQWVML